MLAQCWAYPEKYQYVEHEGLLDWEYRWGLLKQKLLTSINADIICLQEVEEDKYNENFLPLLSECGYEGVMQPKEVGNAIFYRKSRFELQGVNPRSRAIIAKLKIVETSSEQGEGQVDSAVDECLYVANVHLEGSPYKNNERFNQISSLLKELKKMNSNRGGGSVDQQRVVICGDFNCNAQSGICKFLESGELAANYVDSLLMSHPYTSKDQVQPYRMNSTYSHTKDTMPFDFTHREKGKKSETLDFIYYTPSSLRFLGGSEAVTLSEWHDANENYLPNACQPSDHLPVAAFLGYGSAL